jgi:AcrR family transcriptional regulator
LGNDKSTVLLGLQATEPSLTDVQIGDRRRARIVSAMIEIACERGYLGATVALVASRAGVSRRAFYELFDGREECFLAAFEWSVGRAREAVFGACEGSVSWRECTRDGLAGLLRWLEREPVLARLCVIEALGAGKLVLERRAEILEELMDALDAHAPRPPEPSAPLLTSEGIVGGALAAVHGRLLEPSATDDSREQGRLVDLHGQLMALIVLPYLGPQAAGEELIRRAPAPPRGIRIAG